MKRCICFLLFSFSFVGSMAQETNLRFYSEGRIFFAGDAVQTFIIPGDSANNPSLTDENVDVILVNSSGKVKLHENYLITELGKSAILLLPEDLPTDNYRLIAFWQGVQSVIHLHVYQPSVMSSAVLDERLDQEKGIEQSKYPPVSLRFLPDTEGALAMDELSSSGRVLSFVKIAKQSSLNAPGIGVMQPGNFQLPVTTVSVETLSNHPDARISVYFVDQGVVEEHYVNELHWLNLRMSRHYGSSRIWAYQFDERGDKLGTIPISLEESSMPILPSVDRKVPFNKEIQLYLTERKSQKFINQVYGQTNWEMIPFAPEEWAEPEITINVENYANLATLEEVINNVVPKSQVIRKNKQMEIRLSPNNSGYRYNESPFILLNGVPVTNVDSLLEIPSEHIATVSVYNSLESIRRFGTLGRFGVIEITIGQDYLDKYYPLEMPFFKGINDMEVRQAAIKSDLDVRDVLAWEMYINANTINWINSDVTGMYVIYLFRITPDGRELSEEISFEVKQTLR